MNLMKIFIVSTILGLGLSSFILSDSTSDSISESVIDTEGTIVGEWVMENLSGTEGTTKFIFTDEGTYSIDDDITYLSDGTSYKNYNSGKYRVIGDVVHISISPKTTWVKKFEIVDGKLNIHNIYKSDFVTLNRI